MCELRLMVRDATNAGRSPAAALLEAAGDEIDRALVAGEDPDRVGRDAGVQLAGHVLRGAVGCSSSCVEEGRFDDRCPARLC
jgi:hypothetical protein